MIWWNVLDWVDGKTVRLVATLGFEPIMAIGPAMMTDPTNPTTPVPEQALTTQVVNGVTTVVVDQTILNQILPGAGSLKLF